MPRARKTAADLKLMIEEKLRAGHPDCERAEVVINPPAAGRLGRLRRRTDHRLLMPQAA